MENLSILKIALFGNLIGGSPSNEILAEPEQALSGRLSKLAFTVSQLISCSSHLLLDESARESRIRSFDSRIKLLDGFQLASYFCKLK